MLGILVFAVGADAVGRAVHQERIGSAGGVLGHIDRREQPLAVAHGNAELVLGVVGADVVLGRGGRLLGLLGEKGREGQEQHGKNRQGGVQCFVHFGWVLLKNQGNALGRPHGGETAQVAPEHGKPVEPSE